MISASFTPKFNAKEIMSEWIQKDWFILQSAIADLGGEMLNYMQGFIEERRVRPTEATGKLSKNIKLYPMGGFGQAEVGWGIGDMSVMSKQAPYWYIINFGGSSFKGEYHFTPGYFDGGIFKYVEGSKEGKMLPSGVKGIIKPMNYIEASRLMLQNELYNLLNKMANEGESNEAKGHF
jgi:hypothetical protein